MLYRILLLLIMQACLPLTVFALTTPVLLTTIHGDSVSDYFSIGESVGDVNGDGIPDFVVGVPREDYANLYFGGAPFDTLADAVFTKQWEGTFGSTIAGADFNGDGFSDIAIGMPFFTGGVHIFFGGDSIDAEYDLHLTGEYQYGDGDHFGAALTAVGDVNNDGYQDLAVGAPIGPNPTGKVYIYFGSSAMDSIPDAVLEGPNDWDSTDGDWVIDFGASIHKIGDINGDAYDDVLIGSQRGDPGTAQYGRLYLIFGGEEISMHNSEIVYQDSIFPGDADLVTAMGDLNNDGLPDFGMAALGEGGALLIFTDSSFTKVELDPFPGEPFYITGGEDFDGDGMNDMLIRFMDREDLYGGIIYGYLGDAVLEGRPSFTLEGKLRKHISFVGDINNDGYNEFLVGATGDEGKVLIYTFNPNPVFGIDVNEKLAPESFQLHQNYPNPFNPSTTLSYDLPSASHVSLVVYDIAGREVMSWTGAHVAGYHHQLWNGSNNMGRQVPSGIYLYRLVSAPGDGSVRFVETRKMVLLK
ncbi:FG-GAP-like repeat-containing protein [Candidatus Neomarinimicrobiota bacterium]